MNSTGHSAASTASQRPAVDPRSSVSSSSFRASAHITTPTDSAPASRIQATRLPGRRSATNAPTHAGAATAAIRNGA
jgi:hypothetical protein